MNALPNIVDSETGQGLPRYDLRDENHGPSDLEFEIWQILSNGTPYVKKPLRIAGLRDRNLALIEHRVLRLLAKAGIHLGGLNIQDQARYALNEDQALNLGLLFRTLAPMRNRENMPMVADGIEAMVKEEAAYWLGMAMHRKYSRRVLMALRFLLIDPKARMKD